MFYTLFTSIYSALSLNTASSTFDLYSFNKKNGDSKIKEKLTVSL